VTISPKAIPSRLSSVILWSVISAAFIGPGTVTTAVAAGAQFQLSLLWTITFATFGCIVLQEVSARITIASGLTLGQALAHTFGVRRGKTAQWILGVSVMLGCAAYEAGNILGAVSGLRLVTGVSSTLLTIFVTVTAAAVLWAKGKSLISAIMTSLVCVMGIAFVALAASTPLDASAVAKSFFVPSLPLGSGLLVLGLVGTTIVPYNIFIGAGISKGQTIPLMRVGLSVTVLVGGAITAAIVLAGNSIGSFTSFPDLAKAMEEKVGGWGSTAVAFGLFAAGFSSAITSPYAASIISSTVLGTTEEWKSRLVWASVLLTGFVFGISGVKPIPVILAVQAINGMILPLLTIYLIAVVNDEGIVTKRHVPGLAYNLVLLAILFIVLVISLNNIDKSLISWSGLSGDHLTSTLTISALGTLIIAVRLLVKRSLNSRQSS
jgi:manganese transport protein